MFDDDFDSDDFSTDDLRSERDAYKKMPIYIKAMQLCEFGHSFAAFLESEAESKLEGYDLVLAREYAKQILENAYIIPAKIAGADTPLAKWTNGPSCFPEEPTNLPEGFNTSIKAEFSAK